LSTGGAAHPARVVAIDGPSASGKSSTALAVARAFGALHLDSGALYRALTAVAGDLETRTPDAVLRVAEARDLELREVGGELVPFLDGRDAEPLLRSPEVTRLVSEVSAMGPVREWVNTRLRAAVHSDRLVILDGRDIGTVVFPGAPVKIFLTATPEARARRRLLQRGDEPAPGQVEQEAARLAERDRLDSNRDIAPLRPAEDAILLDTTDLSFDEQIGRIVRVIRERLALGG
jgi:cytidylate kinase